MKEAVYSGWEEKDQRRQKKEQWLFLSGSCTKTLSTGESAKSCKLPLPATISCGPALTARQDRPSLSLTVVIIPGWHSGSWKCDFNSESAWELSFKTRKIMYNWNQLSRSEHSQVQTAILFWQKWQPFPTLVFWWFTRENLWLWVWNLLESLFSKTDQTGSANTFVSVPWGYAAKKATPTAIWGAGQHPCNADSQLGFVSHWTSSIWSAVIFISYGVFAEDEYTAALGVWPRSSGG